MPSQAHLSNVLGCFLMFPAGGKLLLWGQIPSLRQVTDHKSLRRFWTPHPVPVEGGKVCVFKRAGVAQCFFWPLLCHGLEFSLNHICPRTLHGVKVLALCSIRAYLINHAAAHVPPNHQSNFFLFFPTYTKILQPGAGGNFKEIVLL